MGKQLSASFPVFGDMMKRIDTILLPLMKFSLLEELSRPSASSRINDTYVAQPAIFAHQVGCCSPLALAVFRNCLIWFVLDLPLTDRTCGSPSLLGHHSVCLRWPQHRRNRCCSSCRLYLASGRLHRHCLSLPSPTHFNPLWWQDDGCEYRQ